MMIYAAAIGPKSDITILDGNFHYHRNVNFTAIGSAEFTIMHEQGHGKGIILEHEADGYAIKKLGSFK